jgi:hypothetical protein
MIALPTQASLHMPHFAASSQNFMKRPYDRKTHFECSSSNAGERILVAAL